MGRAERVRRDLQRAIQAQKALASIRQCQAVNDAGQRCALVEDHQLVVGTPHRSSIPDGRLEWS